MRSAIESKLGEIGNSFRYFNSDLNLKIDDTFNVQFKFCSMTLNFFEIQDPSRMVFCVKIREQLLPLFLEFCSKITPI